MDDFVNWTPRETPGLVSVEGRFVRIEPAQFPRDADALCEAVGGPDNDDLWTHIPIGPFPTPASLDEVFAHAREHLVWRTYLISDLAANAPLGMASYMRIRPEAGSIEVGCIVYSKKLQRTPAATEVMYLMARHVFDDLGYRRYEWKCNDANEGSKRAALRLGFTFEGVFRQDMVMKGRNRDTAWYSMLDSEWPAAKAAFEEWLKPENFDHDGVQRRSLEAIRGSLT